PRPAGAHPSRPPGPPARRAPRPGPGRWLGVRRAVARKGPVTAVTLRARDRRPQVRYDHARGTRDHPRRDRRRGRHNRSNLLPEVGPSASRAALAARPVLEDTSGRQRAPRARRGHQLRVAELTVRRAGRGTDRGRAGILRIVGGILVEDVASHLIVGVLVAL